MHRPPESTARHDAVEFLLGRINYEQTAAVPYSPDQFRLDRMRRLLADLGNPHTRVPAIHVAGTKGKGSTSAFLAAMLTESGYRTGLYTSPHLECLEERFAVDAEQCSADELVQLVDRVREAVAPLDQQAMLAGRPEMRATWFELTTAMAFLFFQLKQVDLAVLEVGLGGRLDSTNVCQPVVTVITSISFDHTRQLGNTLAKIASEKAGIFKPGVPAVSGVRHPEARQAILSRANRLKCPLLTVDQDYFYDFRWQSATGAPGMDTELNAAAPARLDYRDTISSAATRIEQLQLGLLGEHQAANAATAIAVMRVLQQSGRRFSEPAVRRGLAAARCPARVEVVAQNPLTIVDTAHNVASVEALVDTLRHAFRPRRKTLIFAASRDKDAEGMLRILLPHFDHIVFTRYQTNPRAAETDWLLRLAQPLSAAMSPTPPRLTIRDKPLDAWHLGRQDAGPSDLVCITGSFFLAAELRGLIRSEPRSAAVE